MKKRIFFGLIVCGILAQLAVLASLIIQREVTLKRGSCVLFSTAPVDPFDAFRGRYMAISLPALSQHSSSFQWDAGQTAYAVIQCDSNAVGTIASLATAAPSDGLYIRMRVRWCHPEFQMVTNAVQQRGKPVVTSRETGKYTVYFHPVVDRFYVPEKLASEADARAFSGRNRPRQQAFACLRIYKGDAVLEDLQIAGQPLLDVVRETLKQRERK